MAKVLIGFMGAGKSTIASLLDSNFIDMDEQIVQKIGMPIASFFEQYGEAAFRKIESELLSELLETKKVLSTGGGIVENEVNRHLLMENKDTIYLKADFETLYQRIAQDKETVRPLFVNNSKEELKAIFDRRQKWYEELASKTVIVSDKTPLEIVEAIQ